MEHTLDNPYCSNPSCWCHQQSSYHGSFTDDLLWIEPNDQTVIVAIEFLGDYAQQPTYDWQAAA